MTRVFAGGGLILATHNEGKVAEISALLAPYVENFVSSGALGLPEPEETGVTFAENAILKARAAAQAGGLPALADDSGLAVAALNGAPGVFSARWAGPGKDFAAAMTLVHEKLGDSPDRRAAFVCVLALVWPDGHFETAEGVCDGHIVWPPRGAGGFGYDPIFVPDGADRSFGEMSKAEKQVVSHRARAFRELVVRCFS